MSAFLKIAKRCSVNKFLSEATLECLMVRRFM